jgi:ribosomal protein S18 acetylase RimI-like enzyme
MSSVLQTPELVRGLQERVARALTAEHVQHVEGWWLRYSTSRSWWRGTVLPHSDVSRDELLRMIGVAESFYAGFGAAPRFQITSGACPAELDTVLAERGYRRDSPMLLQTALTADVEGQARSSGPTVQLSDRPTREWFEAWYAVHGGHGDRQTEWDRFGRVTLPSAYAAALDGDEVIAAGRAVADTGWAGVIGLATLPAARRRGAGRNMLASLAGWAGGQGADHLYLQVETGNDAARRLYERTGFTELADYHYRTGH